MAEGDVDELRRELEESNRGHAKEVASLQNRLKKSSTGSFSVCSRCTRMDDKKTEDDDDRANAETAIVLRNGKLTSAISGSVSNLSDFSDGTCVYESWEAGAAIYGRGDLDSEFEEDDQEIATPAVRFSRAHYKDLTNLEIDFEDDDGFLCEQCGEPATNGLRVCDSCI